MAMSLSLPAAGTREISARTPRQKFKGHTNTVWGVIHLPGGQRIMTCSADGSLRVWNLKGGLQIGENWVDGKSPVCTIALSPDGKTVASGSEDGVVRLWDIDTGNVIAKWTGHSGRVWSVCWSRDGQRVMSGSADGTARVWDMESGKTILGPINTGPIAGHAVIYSPDETLIATARGESSDIEIWGAKTGEWVGTLKGHTNDVWCLAWTLDGKILISGSTDSSIRTWDTTTWKEIAVLTEHTDIVNGLAISPNGRILASASFDKTVRLWDLEDGRPICSPLQHDTMVTCTSFSADGMLLAAGCDPNVSACTWDVSAIVREAGLDYLLSDSDALQHRKSVLDAHAARRRRLPRGFLDDTHTEQGVHSYSIQLPPRSSTHNLHFTAHPSSTRALLDRFPLLFRSHTAARDATAHTRTKIRFLNWTRALDSRWDQTDIEQRPLEVEVPCTRGLHRNVTTRRKSKKDLPVPNNIMTINVTPPNSGVAQSSRAAQDQPSSSQPQVLPATAIPTSATETPLGSDVMIRRAGCWTRFRLSLCCISAENIVDSH